VGPSAQRLCSPRLSGCHRQIRLACLASCCLRLPESPVVPGCRESSCGDKLGVAPRKRMGKFFLALTKRKCQGADMAEKLTPRDRLAAWLAREGRTKTWVAGRLGVRPERLSRWLDGAPPSPGHRDALAQLTGKFVPEKGDWA
jgi:hypothetical protein